MRAFIEFLEEFELLPLRMWKCVIIMIACAVVMLIEAMVYEKIAWTGPAQVVGVQTDGNFIKLSMKSIDGSHADFFINNSAVTVDYMHHPEHIYQCAVSEFGVSNCTVPK